MQKEIRERFEKAERRITKIEGFFSKEGLSIRGKPVKCPYCKKAWVTRSKSLWITCPRCSKKFKVESKKNSEEEHKKNYKKGKSWGEVAEKSGFFN